MNIFLFAVERYGNAMHIEEKIMLCYYTVLGTFAGYENGLLVN